MGEVDKTQYEVLNCKFSASKTLEHRTDKIKSHESQILMLYIHYNFY